MNRIIPILITILLLFTVHYSFSQGIWKTYTTADGLACDSVNCINQDKAGNMWFGTLGNGLSKLDTNGIWTNFLTRSDRLSWVTDIEIDSLNNKWLAYQSPPGDYVVKFNDSTFIFYHLPTNSNPLCLGQDSLGQIWCGTSMIDSYWFDGTTWHLFYVWGLWEAHDHVTNIRTDRYGKLYFSHWRGVSTMNEVISLAGRTSDLAFDRQNRLWFAVRDDQPGLYMFDGNKYYRWTKDNGLIDPFNQLWDVAVDSNNNVWIANGCHGYPITEFFGVSKFNGAQFIHFNVDDGLVHGFVSDIFVDRKGDIWFATMGGISVLHDTTKTTVGNISTIISSAKTFSLYQNYPNPFNNYTMIRYELTNYNRVELIIFNLTAKEVITLIKENQSAGCYQVVWDGKDATGNQVSSGVYLALLKCGDFNQSIKLCLIR